MKILTPILLAALLSGTALAASNELNISGQVPMYCRDDSGEYQPMQRTTYDRLRQSFTRQFGWRSSLVQSSPSLGTLSFSQPGGSSSRERIYYDVEPFGGGIALLHMHVRLRGHQEDLTGTAMCWKTFGIVEVR